MSVGMPDVHLADVPRHVSGRPRHLEALFHAASVYRVDVVHPDAHPDALVSGVVAIGAECLSHSAAATSTLRAFAEEDLERAGAHAAEVFGIAPGPRLLPSQLLEPGEALLDIRDIQDRRQPVGVHDYRLRTNFISWPFTESAT